MEFLALAKYIDKGTAIILLVGFIWLVKWQWKEYRHLCVEHKNDIKEHKKDYKGLTDKCIDVISTNSEANTKLSESIRDLKTKL